MQIIAMRIAGMSDPEIAEALKISEKSISPYVYRATKNGWLDIEDPTQKLEYQLMHKVVRNLDDSLEDNARHATSMVPVKTQVAMKIAEGTIFKKYDNPANAVASTTIVAVKIEMPEGPRPQIRAGNDVGGVPAHIDAEILNGTPTAG